MMKRILVLLSMCLATQTLPALANTPGEVAVGGVLRDSSMKALSGPPARLSAFRGKPLIINVWASWCGPCRVEMASLERLSRSKAGAQFRVIGISTDDYPEAARAFLRQANTSFSHYIDDALQLENMLGADRLPLTLLVDANGRVLAKYYGAEDWGSAKAMKRVTQAFGLPQ
jgi:thiol-disulfide isomerase/thioredoxin